MSNQTQTQPAHGAPANPAFETGEQESSIMWVVALPVLIAVFLAAIAVVGAALV